MGSPIDALESEYRKYAEAFGKASELGDSKATNRNYAKLAVVRVRLKKSGKIGEAILRRLMNDRSSAIAKCAAADSLPFAEAEALKVLDSIGKKTGSIALDAEMTAELWRAGKLKIS